MRKATARPAGAVYPHEPAIVEQDFAEPGAPVFARKKENSYLSELSSAWKRVSQIGKAY